MCLSLMLHSSSIRDPSAGVFLSRCYDASQEGCPSEWEGKIKIQNALSRLESKRPACPPGPLGIRDERWSPLGARVVSINSHC